VTRLGEFSPFGLLFKGQGELLGQNVVCCMHFKSLEGGMMSMFLALMDIIWPFFGLVQLFWLLYQKFWRFFPKSSGHPARNINSQQRVIL